jgi:salicylate hydroxylase
MTLSVMIIGGGIGGLALAHGLRQAGLDCDVYERTRHRTDWLQGYRIHLSPAGVRALHDCLPPAGWAEFLATVPPGAGGFGFLTDRATDLLALAEHEINDPAAGATDRHYAVSRIRLREILLRDLDRLHLGRTFTHYREDGDRVTAHFEDGTTATADLLIGADGAGSRVRAQLLPRAAGRQDTGVLAVAGQHLLPAGDLPDVLTARANLVVPRGPGSLFTAPWTADPGYVLWGFADASGRFPAGVIDRDGPALIRLVTERLGGWSPVFHRLVGGSDPATVNAFRVRSAIPVEPWPTRRITLLGDAIHHMTPMAGVGANTALRDADLLRRTLTAGRGPLLEALSRYEAEMLDYGFAAVRLSLRNARQAATSTRAGRAAFRTTLRLTAAVPPMRRAMARSLGR